jgi:hydrogenase nickel incorporation protein HypA/HybF
MHELSIAMSLIDAASEELPRLGPGVRVSALHVRLGPLAGVVADALMFSFDMAASGSRIDGARLEIEQVPITVFCDRCATERIIPSASFLHCPVCHAPASHVLTGRELELVALEVIDDAADRGSAEEHPQEK